MANEVWRPWPMRWVNTQLQREVQAHLQNSSEKCDSFSQKMYDELVDFTV